MERSQPCGGAGTGGKVRGTAGVPILGRNQVGVSEEQQGGQGGWRGQVSLWKELSRSVGVKLCRASRARRTEDIILSMKGRSHETRLSGGSAVVQARDSAGWFRDQR